LLNQRLRDRQAGISVVEMMVVVALLGVLTALAIPSFSGWLERLRVRSAAEAIHTGIQLARVEALSRNAVVRFTLQPNGNWSVACAASSTAAGCDSTTALHSRAGAEGAGSFALSVNNSTATLSTDVTVDFLPQGTPDTSVAGYINQVDVVAANDVDSTSVSRALRVTLSNFGRSRLCYPNAAAGEATAC
jgi:type IV fimbrial biogenesis protein FimT